MPCNRISQRNQWKYTFPLFSVLPRVLKNVQMNQVKTTILIVQTWQGQTYCLDLLRLFKTIFLISWKKNPLKSQLYQVVISREQDSNISCCGLLQGAFYTMMTFCSKLLHFLKHEKSGLYQITSHLGSSGLAGELDMNLVNFNVV